MRPSPNKYPENHEVERSNRKPHGPTADIERRDRSEYIGGLGAVLTTARPNVIPHTPWVRGITPHNYAGTCQPRRRCRRSRGSSSGASITEAGPSACIQRSGRVIHGTHAAAMLQRVDVVNHEAHTQAMPGESLENERSRVSACATTMWKAPRPDDGRPTCIQTDGGESHLSHALRGTARRITAHIDLGEEESLAEEKTKLEASGIDPNRRARKCPRAHARAARPAEEA